MPLTLYSGCAPAWGLVQAAASFSICSRLFGLVLIAGCGPVDGKDSLFNNPRGEAASELIMLDALTPCARRNTLGSERFLKGFMLFAMRAQLFCVLSRLLLGSPIRLLVAIQAWGLGTLALLL